MEDIKTPLLDKINFPKDLRKLPKNKLEDLAIELRNETLDVVSVTGGHLGASLGVIELTIAIHYVFNTPKDRLVWDVGHQAYPHKILTGRRDRIKTLRQKNGLYGFTKRTESEYDPFGAAHASTAMSSGLGMAIARDLMKKKNNVICVVGDGAMSGGMAYEAMNNAGSEKSRLIVILNDNDMSIAPPVGALSNYLSRLISSGFYQSKSYKGNFTDAPYTSLPIDNIFPMLYSLCSQNKLPLEKLLKALIFKPREILCLPIPEDRITIDKTDLTITYT